VKAAQYRCARHEARERRAARRRFGSICEALIERCSPYRRRAGWRDDVLAHGDQTSLTERETLDVALRQVDRAVPGEELHVAQAAAGAMKIAGRDGDEGAAPGMRRASLESKFCEQLDKPVHNAVRAHGTSAAGTNDGAARITAAPEDQ